MRGWRRSSRARARNDVYVDAPDADATPNPFAPLAWRPPAGDLPPIAAPPPSPLATPPVATPPVAPPPVAPAPVDAPPVAVVPVEALFVERSPEPELHVHEPVATAPAEGPPRAQPDTPSPVAQPEPQAPGPAPTAAGNETNSEMLRLFEVVTNMCDHVIEYIETDRAERRVMLETLATLARAITDSAAALASRTATAIAIETSEARVIEHPQPRERVVGGSMPAGPDPVIDLRNAPAATAAAPVASVPPAPTPAASAAPVPTPVATSTTVMTTEIAVEVRGRFGDRWVDGFEICEVMETPEGHRYRLRRHRDGVVLPELFDATSIRHVETFDQLSTTNGAHTQHRNGQANGRDASVNDATGYAGAAITGTPAHWSRS